MNGICTDNLNREVTHVIVDTILSAKYDKAMRKGLKVFPKDWITDVWKVNRRHHVPATHDRFNTHKVPVFLNIIVTCANISQPQEDDIKNLIIQNGGACTDIMDDNVQILISGEHTDNTEKMRLAVENDVPCVSIKWIMRSTEVGYALPYRDFLIVPSQITKSSIPRDCCSNHNANQAGIITNINNTPEPDIPQVSDVIDLRGPEDKAGPVSSESPISQFKKSILIHQTPKSSPDPEIIAITPRPSSKKYRIDGENIEISKKGPICIPIPEEAIRCPFSSDSPPLSLSKSLHIHQSPKYSPDLEMIAPTPRPPSKKYRNHLADVAISNKRSIGLPSPEESTKLPFSSDSPPIFLSKKTHLIHRKPKYSPDLEIVASTPRPPDKKYLRMLKHIKYPAIPASRMSAIGQIFQGLTFIISPTEEEAATLKTIISACDGQVLTGSPSFPEIADFGIVPLIGSVNPKNPKIAAKEVVTRLFINDCLNTETLVKIEYYDRPICIADSVKPLSGNTILRID